MKYPVFLQALALTIVVFLIGMYSGVVMEENKFVKMNEYFVDSEVTMLDIMAHENMVKDLDVSCEEMKRANFDLLNKVYEQSVVLDEYESSGRVTNTLKDVHRKYDALRSYLWINSIKVKEKCGGDFNTIVYFYNYEEQELAKRAEQNVWSKVLLEIKTEMDSEIVLVPIAVDTDLKTLSVLLNEYGVETYPSVLINEEHVLSELTAKEDIVALLN